MESKNLIFGDFPDGAVVKNPPANAGDTGLSPSPEKYHSHGAIKPVEELSPTEPAL